MSDIASPAWKFMESISTQGENLKGNHVATCIRPSVYWGTKRRTSYEV